MNMYVQSVDESCGRAIHAAFLTMFLRVFLQMQSNQAMARSDADATYFELEQAALEHSLATHMQHEHGKKKRASSTEDRKAAESTVSVPLPVSAPSSAPLSVSFDFTFLPLYRHLAVLTVVLLFNSRLLHRFRRRVPTWLVRLVFRRRRQRWQQ